MEEVVTVDESGRETGIAEKLRAHREGLLHRAFSIFLVDQAGQLLLQRRSRTKYHSPGLWANSACGHPRPGEGSLAAARRRLHEELGVEVPLVHAFQARYREPVGDGMMENELVEVYFGKFGGEINSNPAEVESVKWIRLEVLQEAIAVDPERYAVWLKVYVAAHGERIRRAVRDSMDPALP